MSELFEKAIVEKRNVLNEIRSNSMSLQEMRLFSIYLSKINPRDISTRVVRFPLEDFQKIMGIGIDINMTHFRYAIRHILQQIVEVPNEKGSGYTAFQLFKEAVVEKDENNEWYVELNAHDMALPLMFDFKERYFNYELWNALRLKSTNQLRVYEILKQYEKLGKRELSIKELRELIGIAKNEYAGRTGWSDFRKYVLDSCQSALKEHTDICYTYERGKTGAGGKWLTIIFRISKNPDFVDKLSLKDFINLQPCPSSAPSPALMEVSEPMEASAPPAPREPEPIVPAQMEVSVETESEWDEGLRNVAGLTHYEFDDRQLQSITKIALGMNGHFWGKMGCVKRAYERLELEAERKRSRGEQIHNRHAYLCEMLRKEIQAKQIADEVEKHKNDWMKDFI